MLYPIQIIKPGYSERYPTLARFIGVMAVRSVESLQNRHYFCPREIFTANHQVHRLSVAKTRIAEMVLCEPVAGLTACLPFLPEEAGVRIGMFQRENDRRAVDMDGGAGRTQTEVARLELDRRMRLALVRLKPDRLSANSVR